MAFLLEPDINIIKKVCQHNIFKESGSKELVCLCIHFIINLHHLHCGNPENQFISCLSKSLFLKNFIKNGRFKQFFNNIDNNDKRHLHNEMNS